MNTESLKDSVTNHSKLGMISLDWNLKLGKQLFEQRKEKGYKGLEIYSVTINSGLVKRKTLDKRMAPNVALEQSLLIEKDDIVYNMMRMWQGAIGHCDFKGVVSPAYVVCRTKGEILSLFAYYLLKTPRYLHLLKSYSYGITNDRLRLYFADFSIIPFTYPSILEQRKIIDVLKICDSQLDIAIKLIKAKKKKKEGLMQLLLSGRKRFSEFNNDWIEVKLEDYFTERKESKYENLQLLSIGSNGVYPQNESELKDNSNFDKSKYKRICKGDIGYNTMRMWQGRSALSSLEGIVSPAYTIVTPKENADVLFFSYLFKFPYVVNRFYRNSQGLVNDTLNCKFKDFAIVKVMVPPTKEEQSKIANVLSKAEIEIKVLEQKKDYLQDQKKGLMQQLLTGKKRLKY